MFGLHPVHALAVLIDCAMGAWLGHDGFQVRHSFQESLHRRRIKTEEKVKVVAAAWG